MTFLPKIQEHLDTLEMFPDRQDRIEALIDLAQQYQHPDAAAVSRDENCKVPGCESEVFVSVEQSEGRYRFKYAVDNPQGISAMAMAVILEEGLEDATADEVRSVSEDLVLKVFGNELSMGKNLGLTNMIRVTKHLVN